MLIHRMHGVLMRKLPSVHLDSQALGLLGSFNHGNIFHSLKLGTSQAGVYSCYHSVSNNSVNVYKTTNSTYLNIVRHQVRKADQGEQSKSIAEAKEKPFGELSTSQKVARAGKDATYSMIVIAGIAVTGGLFFAIGRELFSGQSPSGVYAKAFKLIKNHDDIEVWLGPKLKAHGEMNRRGRARHVSHYEYEVDGVKHMRMKFYVEGDKKGTAHLEVVKQGGSYEFRYLFVDIEDYPPRTIVVVDNRREMDRKEIDRNFAGVSGDEV